MAKRNPLRPEPKWSIRKESNNDQENKYKPQSQNPYQTRTHQRDQNQRQHKTRRHSRLSLFVIIFSPRPFPSINKKFLNFDGHQVATGVRSARVARIQRQNLRSLSLTIEFYRGDLKKTILAITHLQLRMIYLTPMRENNVKPQRSRATLVARKFIAHRKRASNGARCVIR